MASSKFNLETQLASVFGALRRSVQDPKERTAIYDKLLKRGSIPIAKEMRRRASLGGYSHNRLVSSIKAYTPTKVVKRKVGYDPNTPLAIVSPKVVKKGGTSNYPHYWHWYEYGTKQRKIKKPKAVTFRTKSGNYVTVPASNPNRGKVKALHYGRDTYNNIGPHLTAMLPALEKALDARLVKELNKRGITYR